MEVARSLLTSLFPSRCIICQKTVATTDNRVTIEICKQCYNALPFNNNHCVRYALPLPVETKDKTMCGRCIKQQPQYDYVHSVFRYEKDVIRLIHALKFADKITCAHSIGEMLLSKLDPIDLPDKLLPVPLHKRRLRKRGFNQSIEISRVMAKRYEIPIETRAVVRERSTVAQSGLDAKQRLKNIKDSFNVISQLDSKHVLIVDDVMTTGATVNELAKVLKRNGVERVGVICIARAPIKG